MAPKFIVTSGMGMAGRPGVHQLRTDLLLLTRLAGMALGPGPEAVDQSLNGLISRKAKQLRFTGELGKHLLVELDPKVHKDNPQRYVMLMGLGNHEKFDGRACCQVFRTLVDKAIELGVKHLTIPFAPNRMTGMNLRGTAHLLREVVEEKAEALGDNFQLELIELYCTPAAKRHIEAGLKIPGRHKRACCIEES